MNLLLLLSALLSALTGVSASARVPQVSTELAASTVRAVIAVAPGRTMRPAVTLPDLRALSHARRAVIWSLAAIEPLFASRRRE